MHRRFSTSCFSTEATATSQVVNCSHDNSKKTPLFPILTLLPPTSPLSASPLTLFSSHPWWWWYCKSLDPRCRRFVRRRLLPSHHGYKPGNRVSRGVPPLRNGHGREVVVEVVFLRVHDMKGKGGHQEHHSGGQRQQRLRPRHSRTAVNNTVAGNDVRPFDDC